MAPESLTSVQSRLDAPKWQRSTAVEGLKDRCRVEAIYWMEDGPMSEHKVSVKWARNSTDFGYKNYNRDHVWRFDSGVEVPASAPPAYLGNPQRVDPEAAFVAALSSCHMLTFLALASNKGFVVDSYEDNAVGHVEKTPTASSPSPVSICIQILPTAVPCSRRLDWLHDKAHRECLIANSATTKISVVPTK